jgi:hypothetical protein
VRGSFDGLAHGRYAWWNAMVNETRIFPSVPQTRAVGQPCV